MSKSPATDRHHGGPGSSQENAKKPELSAPKTGSGGHANNPPTPGSPTNPNHAQISGGGGEQDRHHTHDPHTKR